MKSTFSGFTTALQAMNASQSALQVTGQNIANINTTGYTIQQVDLVSLNLKGAQQTSSSASSKIGYGVEVTGISQIRDPFLDVQYRNQIAQVGTTNVRQGILDQLGNIFDETDSDAVKTAISNIKTQFSNYLGNSDTENNNNTFDSLVRTSCGTLINYIHQKSSDLSTLWDETLGKLESTDIPAVNTLLTEIGELNDAIWNSQSCGNPALELQDARNLKLDDLALALPISVSYKEVEISTGNKLSYPVVKFTGSDGKTYDLTAGEHGENVASLSMERNKGADGNEDGTVSISLIPASDYSSNYEDLLPSKADITDYLKEGTLKGTVDMLNKSGDFDVPPTDYAGLGYYKKYFDVFVQTFAETFNELNTNTTPYTGASSLPTSGTATQLTSTGTEYAEYNLDFSSSSGNFLKNEIININGQNIVFGNGANDTVIIGDTLKESLTNLADKLNIDAPNLLVNSNDTAGTWSYDSNTESLKWTSNAALTSGDIITSDSVKTKDGAALSLTYTANPTNIKSYDLFKTSDGSSTITASNIKISDDWSNGYIGLICSRDEASGSKANDNLTKMYNAITASRDFKYEYTYVDKNGVTQTESLNIFTGGFDDCYSKLELTQGQYSSANNSAYANAFSVLAQTSNSRDSVSGVSLDEEGINLMQYQRSYTAACRLMTTLDEALEVLINNTGIVGR